MTACASSTPVDVRKLAPHDRYPVASAAFHLLDAGESMELVHDQDLKAVKRQFESRLPGKFSWTGVEQGPAVWRAAITRMKSGHGNGGCCGGCGGA
ncbi:DUF2249 domain-containing protein [Polaromonas sp. CG_9.11]|uniref:DUF2249 domain-containing protein n=1 Tax=Polaromonas sp. CG_9.11 TaxID=2787730 RepID=UPI0018CB8312|nr:DUF2249 domain-containing protein [Polaromonas sp. CG_9.11]MBG6076739.1 uncharacterized protein (DUF2249 family) [Polaromonas sp. CG_9.11]